MVAFNVDGVRIVVRAAAEEAMELRGRRGFRWAAVSGSPHVAAAAVTAAPVGAVGRALFTLLNPRGSPCALACCRLLPAWSSCSP